MPRLAHPGSTFLIGAPGQKPGAEPRSRALRQYARNWRHSEYWAYAPPFLKFLGTAPVAGPFALCGRRRWTPPYDRLDGSTCWCRAPAPDCLLETQALSTVPLTIKDWVGLDRKSQEYSSWIERSVTPISHSR